MALFIAGYIGILLMNIKTNNEDLQEKNYHDWTAHYLRETADGTYVDSADKGSDVSLSEGQGYGMVITVLAAEKGYADEKAFQPLYEYYQNYRLKDSYLMSWRQRVEKGQWVAADNNATDGDLDIAYALVKASQLWPNSANDYQTAAKKILNSIQAENYNPDTGLLTVGNWATMDKKARTLLRPSDIMPSYYEAFAKFTGDDFWQSLTTASVNALKKISDTHQTGLIPDFVWVTEEGFQPAKAKEVDTRYDGDYAYNACRIPMRLVGTDNATVKKIQTKMLDFFQEQAVVTAGYQLKGKPLNEYQSASFSAPILLAADQDKNYAGLYEKQTWIFSNPIEGKNYYGDSLKMLTLLQLYK